MTMEGGSQTRRSMLKAGGVTLVVTMAGCLGEVPIGGGGSSSYLNWIYEPGEFTDRDYFQAAVYRPTAIADHEDELDDDVFDQLEETENRYSHMDVDFEDLDMVLSFSRNAIVTGDYDSENVIEELEDKDYDDETEHEDYQIFLSQDERLAVGVSDEALVQGRRTESDEAPEVVEYLIDTSLGEEDRYIDEDEDFSVLTDTLDPGTVTGVFTYEERDSTDVETGTFEHAVGSGLSLHLDGETTTVEIVIAFEDGDDVEVEDVEEWANENDGNDETFDDVDDIDVVQDGRTAVLTGKIDTDDLSSRLAPF